MALGVASVFEPLQEEFQAPAAEPVSQTSPESRWCLVSADPAPQARLPPPGPPGYFKCS